MALSSAASAAPKPHIHPIPRKDRRGASGFHPVNVPWDGQSRSGAGYSPVVEIVHKMNTFNPKRPERKFVPVHDVEGYVSALIYHGLDKEEAEKVRRQHMEALATFDRPPPPVKKPLNVPRILKPVNVLLEVSGDKVKLILTSSMTKLHEEYLSKCKRPPIGKLVRAMAGANYPQEKIDKAINHYNWVETHQEELEEEFERLFPSTGSKKNTVVKKATKAVKKI